MPPGRPSMGKNDIFFDSSALIAGIVSPQGAARALLLLAEDEKIRSAYRFWALYCATLPAEKTLA
jgi:hypothetical protein